MTDRANDYSDVKLTVLEFDDAVRKRPAMYFGVAREDPELATRVLCAVLRHALHPAATVAADHTPQVIAEISGDLAFSVVDDQADALTDRGTPRRGYCDSLLATDRWASAAAAALSSQTTVEVWRSGRGFRQQLVGVRPIEPPAEFSPPTGEGTRVTYVLDTDYFNPGAAITADLAGLDLHGPHCTCPAGPGYVIIRDLRQRNRPAEYRWD